MFGELIDTARGQTVSSVIDPLNGHQVSDMASIARLAVVALALRLGALEMCVQSLEHSYELFPLSNLSMWHTSMVEVLHRAVVLLQSTVSLASLWFVSYLAIDILAALLAKVMHGLSFTSSATIAKTCVTVFLLLKVVLDPQEIAEVLKRCVFQYASVRSSANQDLIVQHTKVEMNDSSFASAE
jgi:type III secretory pathway component EscT